MLAQVISRVLAIAILSVPVGYVCQEVDDQDWKVIQEYSHAELLAHLETMRLPGHIVAIIVVFLVGCGVTACVELVAWVIRFPFRDRVSP